MKLLLISNSTNAGEAYLAHPKEQIGKFLKGVRHVAFVPYAAVTLSYDEYEEKVRKRFLDFDIGVDSIHHTDDPAGALRAAEAIVVGGGNTFYLLKQLQDLGLVDVIRERVSEGVPFVGWSAGSNVACPTICTTNDMPIVEPRSFHAVGLVPFQINPHYLDAHPEGHAGETRQQRLEEYAAANRKVWVAGLREGCMFWVEGDHVELTGPRPVRLFRYGQGPVEFQPGDDLDFLLG